MTNADEKKYTRVPSIGATKRKQKKMFFCLFSQFNLQVNVIPSFGTNYKNKIIFICPFSQIELQNCTMTSELGHNKKQQRSH